MPNEDYEFLLRVLLAGPTMVHVPSTGFIYRLHTDGQLSFSSSGSAMRAKDYVNYVGFIRQHLRENRTQFTWFDRAGWWLEDIAAQRALKELGGVDQQSTDWREALRDAPLLWTKVSSVVWQASRKFHGRVYHSYYGEGHLNRTMGELILELGYEPRESPI
jgi:hypothetical protein